MSGNVIGTRWRQEGRSIRASGSHRIHLGPWIRRLLISFFWFILVLEEENRQAYNLPKSEKSTLENWYREFGGGFLNVSYDRQLSQRLERQLKAHTALYVFINRIGFLAFDTQRHVHKMPSSSSEEFPKQEWWRVDRNSTQQDWIPKLIRMWPNDGQHVRKQLESVLKRSLGGGKWTPMVALHFLWWY